MMRNLTGIILILTLTYSCKPNFRPADELAKNPQKIVQESVNYISFPTANWDTLWSTANEVKVHIVSEPENLHPTNSNSQIRSVIFELIHRAIINSDMTELKLRPSLIKSMPVISANEREFTYELRDDVFWDNGNTLLVEDILFTIKASICNLVNNPHHKSYFDNLINIGEMKGNKFRLFMTERYLYNIEFLSVFPILQRSVYDPENLLSSYTLEDLRKPLEDLEKDRPLNDWAIEFNNISNGRDISKINGLGPYKITEWETGRSIVLERKEKHWTDNLTNKDANETSLPDKISFIINQDKNSQILAFRKNQFDVSSYLNTGTLMELQQEEGFSSNYHSAFVPSFNFSYLAFNCKQNESGRTPLFQNKETRRALAHLVPIMDIIHVVLKGKGTVMKGPVSPLKYDYNDNIDFIDVDVNKAIAILTEQGWKDTDGDGILDKEINGSKTNFEFELKYLSVSPDWKDMAELIKETMADASVKVNLKGMEYGPFLQEVQAHSFDAMLCAWGGSSSPDDHSQLWKLESWSNNGANYSGFGSPESDALIDSINVTIDADKRKKYSVQFQEIVADQQPYVFINASTRKLVIHKRFANIRMYIEKPGVLLNNLMLNPDRD